MQSDDRAGFETPETVTATEACELLDISYPTLNRWLKQGHLSYIKLPSNRRRIPLSEIQRLLHARTNDEDQA
jgi:excisionase family DNA binding protein